AAFTYCPFWFTLVKDSVTHSPPGPAVPFNVTVPVALVPPLTDAGLTVTASNRTGCAVRMRVCVMLPDVPITPGTLCTRLKVTEVFVVPFPTPRKHSVRRQAGLRRD